ncbi:winged helix-turn-helix domain-containing protein [Acidaminobacter sp. JC074]|uniref:winged helix-turn-helix domain-containing protein n=1 Tax=Acidaminobacter sp. JC074 TaxID=2530199 RepID=UPI001F0E39A1|nr:crosslink repair DNA glycosylase YcaQ family protein [Acidaminobacter sp. JC074]MCH4886767.1 winged helix-turn-helix domain-containing protein [Acidaminobacter sp. JC074]
MNEIKVTKADVRRFLVDYHGMLDKELAKGKEGVLDYVKKVGCIQFDPLNVVGRNPDLVLQSKIENYSPKMLEELLYKDRKLIDGWDKMMAIYSVDDWPYFKRIRSSHAKSTINTMAYRSTEEALDYLDHVLEILYNEGPKFSREINIGGKAKGRWASSRFSNVALDHLFHLGKVGVVEKKNNQKLFDLIENLLDKDLLEKEDPFDNDREFVKWYILRRIKSVGILWSKNGGGWLGHYLNKKPLRAEIIEELLEQGLIESVLVEGIKDKFYIAKEHLDSLLTANEPENKSIRFLAPLDNIMWDRGLISKIFDFEYTWEVYVPKDKRKYGYYVLPVLYGSEIVARFEPEKPEDGRLTIANWWWEEGVEVDSEMKEAVKDAFEDFSRYLKLKISKRNINKVMKTS